jgi:hypothetical protein
MAGEVMAEKMTVAAELIAALDAMAEIVDDAEMDMPESLSPDYGQDSDSDTIDIHRCRAPIFKWRGTYDDQIKKQVHSLWRYHRLDLFPPAWGPPHWKPIDAALTATLRTAGQSVLALDLRTGPPHPLLSHVVELLRSARADTGKGRIFLGKAVKNRTCEEARLASEKRQYKLQRTYERRAVKIRADYAEAKEILREIVAALDKVGAGAAIANKPISDDWSVTDIVMEVVQNARKMAMGYKPRWAHALQERPRIEPLYYDGTIALLAEALDLLRAEIATARQAVVAGANTGLWPGVVSQDQNTEAQGGEYCCEREKAATTVKQCYWHWEDLPDSLFRLAKALDGKGVRTSYQLVREVGREPSRIASDHRASRWRVWFDRYIERANNGEWRLRTPGDLA